MAAVYRPDGSSAGRYLAPRHTPHHPGAVISPDRGLHGLLVIAPAGITAVRLDAAFPVLHGKNGEDGTVQGLLELAGIPIVGCGTCASAVCMDKDLAHRLAGQSGVAVPRSVVFRAGEDRAMLPSQAARLGYPLFVKPARAAPPSASAGWSAPTRWTRR